MSLWSGKCAKRKPMADAGKTLAQMELDAMRERLLERVLAKQDFQKCRSSWNRYCGAIRIVHQLSLISEDEYFDRLLDQQRIISLAQSKIREDSEERKSVHVARKKFFRFPFENRT